jgi:signal transduction histidine kinase
VSRERQPAPAPAPFHAIPVLGAAALALDRANAVRQSVGWEAIVGSPPPASLVEDAAEPEALIEPLVAVVEEARRRRRPSRRVARVDVDRKRYYVLAAGPAAGEPSGADVLAFLLEITEGFGVGPREGDEIRQLAHDLRTPLTSMSGAVELLETGRLGQITAEQTRLLGMLQDGLQMMLTLIDDASARAKAAQGLIAAPKGGNGGDD